MKQTFFTTLLILLLLSCTAIYADNNETNASSESNISTPTVTELSAEELEAKAYDDEAEQIAKDEADEEQAIIDAEDAEEKAIIKASIVDEALDEAIAEANIPTNETAKGVSEEKFIEEESSEELIEE